MTNKVSLARHGYEKQTTVAPPAIKTPGLPEQLPTTTSRPVIMTPQPVRTTTPVATTSLTPFSYDEVSLPPNNAAERALIKVLEEAVRIEHERRQNKIRSCRHSPSFRSFKIPNIPRCSCGPSRPRYPTNCWTGILPGLSSARDGMISRFPTFCCGCLTTASHRYLEELFKKMANRPNKVTTVEDYLARRVNRTRRDSLDDLEDSGLEEVSASETKTTNQLPRSGRTKWLGNFGCRTGGWGTGN